MTRFSDYAAIDPLALVLPMSVYVIIAEKLHPHEPKVAEIREAAKSLTPEERGFILTRARALAKSAQAVVDALG
jgi:hypothetical protein